MANGDKPRGCQLKYEKIVCTVIASQKSLNVDKMPVWVRVKEGLC